MSRIGCQDAESSSISVDPLVPPTESEIPGPQFDLDCPEFEIPCVCTPITTDTTIQLLGPFATPYVNLNTDCTVIDGCDSYHISLDLGVPTATIPSLSLACGLDTDVNGALIVDFTDVVGNGLEWDAETCQLLLDDGCGIFLGEGLEVDFDALVGNPAETGLVVFEGDDCSAIGVDPVATVTYEYPDDEIISLTLVEGKLRLAYKRRTITVTKNAAGIPNSFFVAGPVDGYTEIDVCDFTCCTSLEPLMVLVEATPDPADVDEPITWNAIAVGGDGNYTYSWTFSEGYVLEGESELTDQSPVVHWGTSGTKTGSVIVTDGCENEAEDSENVDVEEVGGGTGTCEDPFVVGLGTTDNFFVSTGSGPVVFKFTPASNGTYYFILNYVSGVNAAGFAVRPDSCAGSIVASASTGTCDDAVLTMGTAYYISIGNASLPGATYTLTIGSGACP